MGFFDRIKGKRAYGKVSEKAETGVDLDEDRKFISDTKHELRTTRKGEEDSELFESREQARKRRGDSFRSKIAPVRKGVKTARREFRKFKNDPEVKEIRKTFGKMGRDAEAGMGFGGFEGFSAEGMLGMSSPRKASKRAHYEPVYGKSGKRIGSRKVYIEQSSQPSSLPQGGRDVFDMFGFRNGGYGQVRRAGKRSNDPFDFSDIL